MRMTFVTEAAPGHPNEDSVAATPNAVVLLDASGPIELIRHVREAEQSDPDGSRWPRGKVHDDATAALWKFS